MSIDCKCRCSMATSARMVLTVDMQLVGVKISRYLKPGH